MYMIVPGRLQPVRSCHAKRETPLFGDFCRTRTAWHEASNVVFTLYVTAGSALTRHPPGGLHGDRCWFARPGNSRPEKEETSRRARMPGPKDVAAAGNGDSFSVVMLLIRSASYTVATTGVASRFIYLSFHK